MNKTLKISSFWCLLILVLGTCSCHSSKKDQTKNKTSVLSQDKTAESPIYLEKSTLTSEPLPKSFYKQFTGKVAGNQVRLVLSSIEGKVSGKYIYNKHKEPAYLKELDRSRGGDTIILGEMPYTYQAGQKVPTWKLIFAKGQLFGKWYNKDKTQSVAIHLKEDYPAGVHHFSFYHKDSIVYIKPGDTASKQYKLKMTIPIAHENNAEGKWLNQEVQNLLNIKKEETFEDFTRRIWFSNLSDFRGSKDNLDWDYSQEMTIVYNQHNYVILSNAIYQFYGGAHGVYGETYSCLDMKHKKVMQLKDITDADSTTIGDLLEQHFRTKHHLTPEESLKDAGLFKDELMPNKNFYFTDQGLVFYYNPYEVGPFVLGNIMITIPWKELRPYINKEFFNRMELKFD